MTDAEKLARAIILFLRGGAWSQQDHANWLSYTGSPLVRTTILSTLAAKIIDNERNKTSTSQSNSTRKIPPDGSIIQSQFTTGPGASPLHLDSSAQGTLWPVEPDSNLVDINRRGGHDWTTHNGVKI